MRIKELNIKNYRNCTNIIMDTDFDKVIIIGKNAQGKTNILESIYFLSTLKTPRTSNIKELLKFNETDFNISCSIIKNDIPIELSVDYTIDKTKQLKLNGLKTTSKNYKSTMNTVLFSTQDLSLLRGSPQDRRNWLDTAISQLYPIHDDRLNKYNKIRLQKNNLLKEQNIDLTLLNVYNEQLCLVGTNIIYVRQKFLKELKKYATTKYSEISSTESFDFEYSFPYFEQETISKHLSNEMKERTNEEIARHQTCVGPHRDDVYFYINNNDATKFSSQGQQRTVVLALKLAEIELIKDKKNYSPILLLDDVLAELDDLRQNYLLKSIANDTQTIITSVDTLLFDNDFLKNVKIYKIADGEIV